MSRSNSISSNSRSSSYTKKQSSARTEIQRLPFGQQMLFIYPEQINSKRSIIDFQKQMQSFKNPLFIHPNHEHYYCVNIWKKFFGILDAPLFIIPSSEIDLLHKQSLALIKKFNSERIYRKIICKASPHQCNWNRNFIKLRKICFFTISNHIKPFLLFV